MELLVLGPLEVCEEGRRVALPGGKHKSILAVLLLHAGRSVSGERILDDVWGERPPNSGLAALQVYMSRLRKALPAGTVVSEAGGYRLAAQAAEIDAHRFAMLVEQGRRAVTGQEPERAHRLLGEALALWRGPALADFAYDDFAQGEIARLEELRLAALEDRVDAALALGRHAELVAELEALVAAHPLRERLRGQLMLALYRSGRQADALDAYQTARSELVEHLGIEPGPGLRALEAAILVHDPNLGAAAVIPASQPVALAPRPPPAGVAAVQKTRKVVTVLFSDVVSSSALASELDPEWLERVMGRLFDTAEEVVGRHGGIVDKFIGDAVMAVFGVPQAQEDDALRALRAAFDLRDALASLNEELQREWGVRITLRTGINTGEVMVGDPALGRLLTGDAVVIAKHLQDAAAPGEILVGERTAVLARGACELSESIEVAAKGRALRARRVIRARSWERPRGLPSASRTFAGRRQELDLLALMHERTITSGRPHLVAILGEPGVGKTTLVEALRRRIGPGARWHVGRCASYGRAAASRALAEILRGWLGVDEDDGAQAVLEQLGDRRILGLTLGLDVGAGAGPEDARRELQDAWVELLSELGADEPAVVVFEDLQWADDGLLELLERAVREATGRLLMLVTARPELAERAPGWAGGSANASQLRLDPLAPGEAADMLSQLAGPLDDALRAHLLERAGGNPLFLEEALAALIDRGALATDPEGWEAVTDVPVPDSVHALVAARVDLLPSAERQALQAAAVVGRTFWEGAVRELCEGADFDLLLLEQRGFVRRRPRSSLRGERELVFAHALTREVAYGALPRARRAGLHARAGDWLESAGADATLLADHYRRALELAVQARESPRLRRHVAQRSFRYRVLAAGRALRSADPASAAALLGHDQDLRELEAPDLGVVAQAGRLLVALGRFDDAIDLLSNFASSDHAGTLRELGIAMCKRHRDRAGSPEYARGQAYLQRAAAAGDADATASLAGTWKGLDERKARELYRRASALDPADPYALGSLLELEIEAAGDLSPVEEMRERVEAAVQRCRRQGTSGENLPWAYYDLGKFQLLLGAPYPALEAYAKAIDLSSASFMVETSLASLRRLHGVAERVAGLAWSRDLLELAVRARSVQQHADPVVIIAGGTSAEDELEEAYGSLLLEGFRDFAGTVASGGTVQGVSGLAGALSSGVLRTIGYLPRTLPADARADERYDELRRTDAADFTPLEPLTCWSDLLRDGIAPAQVKVLGIGGGRLAAGEYAIALALGAELGVVAGSGRAADAILADPHWSSSRRLTALEPVPESIRSFLAVPRRMQTTL